MRLLPALLLALALTATGAPLPFPRKCPHPALKVIQGEWIASTLSVEGLVTLPPRLSVSVKGDRLTLYHDGERAFEWAASPAPKPIKDGQAFRLAPPSGVSARQGAYHAGKDSLTLILTREDIGRLPTSKYSKDAPGRAVLALSRKAP